MNLFEVAIEGTASLLMHRFGEHAEGDARKATRRTHIAEESPRAIAERAAYRETGGSLYVPGAAISRLLREAGSGHKQRGSRRSLKYVVPAAVRTVEDAVPLFDMDRATRIRDFEVDARPVTIPSTKGRIMRFRPRIDQWTARFHLRVNESLLAAATIRQLLIEGGEQLGIGDYRPERGGPFGTFALVEWKEARPRQRTELSAYEAA
jgi:hypothetical protein